jgi:hypothetical protein
MQVCYIAGPITGVAKLNRPAFERMSATLNRESVIVLNPMDLPSGLSEFAYMDICLAMVRHCDAVVALDGWQVSKGARAEIALAEKLGKAVLFEPDCVFAIRQHREQAANVSA